MTIDKLTYVTVSTTLPERAPVPLIELKPGSAPGESHTCERIRYRPETRELVVEYRHAAKDGTKIYSYREITPEQWAECQRAERPGTWVRRTLAQPRWPFDRLRGWAWDPLTRDFVQGRVMPESMTGDIPSSGIVLMLVSELGGVERWWPEVTDPVRACSGCMVPKDEDTLIFEIPGNQRLCGECWPKGLPIGFRLYSTAICPEDGRQSYDEDGCCASCGQDTDANGPLTGMTERQTLIAVTAAGWWRERIAAAQGLSAAGSEDRPAGGSLLPVATEEDRRARLDAFTQNLLVRCETWMRAQSDPNPEYQLVLSVDYEPKGALREAIVLAGLDPDRLLLDRKVMMLVRPDELEVSDGYGAPYRSLLPTEVANG